MTLQVEPGAPIARGWQRHIWSKPRRAASKTRSSGHTALDRAAQLLFPWAPENYPGLVRGAAELLKRPVRTVLNWRYGRRRAPEQAYDVLIETLQRRIDSDTQAIAELKKEKGR